MDIFKDIHTIVFISLEIVRLVSESVKAQALVCTTLDDGTPGLYVTHSRISIDCQTACPSIIGCEKCCKTSSVVTSNTYKPRREGHIVTQGRCSASRNTENHWIILTANTAAFVCVGILLIFSIVTMRRQHHYYRAQFARYEAQVSKHCTDVESFIGKIWTVDHPGPPIVFHQLCNKGQVEEAVPLKKKGSLNPTKIV